MDQAIEPPMPPPVTTRGRARSRSVAGENPLLNPITAEEQALTNLIKEENRKIEHENGGRNSNINVAQVPDYVAINVARAAAKAELERRTSSEPDSTTADTPTPPIPAPRLAPSPKMSYQNFESGGPNNPRQAPPSPSQGMNHVNGMNGAMGIGGGMVGFPTPAGHQSDLNFIMSMVEELSRTLDGNQRLASSVVEKVGLVTERARNMDLNNDQLMSMVSEEMEDVTKNALKEVSDLRQQLQKAEYDKDENWKLVIHSCNILADLLDKVHKFKETSERDVLAWHKNYRQQLAVEREQNLALNNQINDMRASACRANEHLRGLRRALTDDLNMNEKNLQIYTLRLMNRSWKRMALHLYEDDDSEFSDDDDIKDPVYRARFLELRELAAMKVERKKQAEASANAKAKEQEVEANDNGGGEDNAV